MTKKSQQIDTLTGLRAVAALWVVLFHATWYFHFNQITAEPLAKSINPNMNPFIAHGFLGVDIFFILSGFVISYRYWAIFSEKRLRAFHTFIIHRLARIYPGFICVYLFSCVLAFGHLTFAPNDLFRTFSHFLNSLPTVILLLFAWVHINLTSVVHAFWAANLPLWSISLEWFAYLCFPFVAMYLPKIKIKWCLLILIMMIIVLQILIYTYPISFASEKLHSLSFFIYGFPGIVRVVIEFFIGCVVFMLTQSISIQRHSYLNWMTLLSILMILIIISYTSLTALTIPFIALFIYCLSQSPRFLQICFGNKIIVYLGKISYSIYLIHFLILQIIVIAARHWPSLLSYIGLFGFIVITIAFSSLLYHGIEKPGRRWIRHFAKGKQ